MQAEQAQSLGLVSMAQNLGVTILIIPAPCTMGTRVTLGYIVNLRPVLVT